MVRATLDRRPLRGGIGPRSSRIYGVIALYAFFLWVYGAAIAVFEPSRLGEPLTRVFTTPRTDSSATVAFIVSGLFYLLGAIGQAGKNGISKRKNVLDSLLRTAMIYGFLGWLYIAGNSLVHPATLTKPLSHLVSIPTESQFGLGCFVASGLACLLLSILGSPLFGPRRVRANESKT
jgi:hypothetical protein